jgi:dolichol-phosphate mannosyltransferase
LINVLLPCFNEQCSLQELVDEVSQACWSFDYQIIAVDDGSTDGTYFLLQMLSRTYPIVVLKHECNRGLHEALKTLLLWIYDNASESDYVITMDSDLTHDPKYIPYLVSACKEQNTQIAIASRFVNGGKQVGVPFSRGLLSRGLRAYINLKLEIPVKDASSGFRCIQVANIKSIIDAYGRDGFIEAEGFDAQLELLYKMLQDGAKVTEVPFILDYSRKKSPSKLKIRRTISGYLKTVSKLMELHPNIDLSKVRNED